jgi:para-aminobenzoate synthetase component 1
MANSGSKTKEKVVIKEIDSNIDLLKIFHYSHARSGSFFLDSALQNQKTGRYSFIGYDPFLTIMSKGDNILIQDRQGITKKKGNPFGELRNLLNRFRLDNNSGPVPFTGGAAGYFAYDLCHFIEELPNTTIDDIGFPAMYFNFYDTIIGFDHVENKS